LIRYHTDIEYITTFLRHTCVSSSDRHDIFNFSYEPHENVAVIHFLQKITHFAHILQLDRQLYAPKTLHETPLISFCPNFHSLDILAAKSKIRYYKDVTLCENYVRDFFIAAILSKSNSTPSISKY
jgi:hypothetical protein